MGIILPGLKGNPESRDIDALLGRLFNIHQIVVFITLPLVLGAMIMSCYWAYTSSMTSHYTSPSNDWQTCLMNTYLTVPLSANVALNKQNTQNCVIGQFFAPNTTCVGSSVSCVQQLQKTCLGGPAVTNDIKIPVGKLLQSLSYFGIQTAIFSIISHASLNRALRHPSWMGATIALILWGTWAMLTYYTAGPVLPVPSETNSTLVIVMYYAKKYVFDNQNGGDNQCDKAYSYLWVYVALLLAIIILNFGVFLLGCIGEYARRHAPNRKLHMPLSGTSYPIIACSLAAVCYVLTVIGKLYSSVTTINSIRSFNMTPDEVAAAHYPLWFDDSYFPFQVSNLDLNTVAWIGSFMAVIRGYSRQSVSAFRLSAIMAFAFILTSYPGLIGAIQFYKDNEFTDDDKCRDFFTSYPQWPAFGYPSDFNAENYCSAFRLSLAGYLGLFLCMHVIMLTAGFTYQANFGRESAIFDPLDPHHPSTALLDDTNNVLRGYK